MRTEQPELAGNHSFNPMIQEHFLGLGHEFPERKRPKGGQPVDTLSFQMSGKM